MENAHCPNCCGVRVWCRKADYVKTLDVDALRVPEDDLTREMRARRGQFVFVLGKTFEECRVNNSFLIP